MNCTQIKNIYLLEQSDVNSDIDRDIYDILYWETEDYFSGKKELDEVCKVIQSRVSLCLNERR